jgi:membrane associated rhomboid family serine protease
MPTKSPATYAILGLSCILYLFSLLWSIRLGGGGDSGGGLLGFDLGGINGTVLERLGASLPLSYDLQEPWRFVMAVFLHGGLLHIGFNMWVLMDIGPVIEELYGSARYFFIYVATGIFGYVLSSFRGSFSVGGSGALLGLIGVLLAMTMGHQTAGMKMLRGQLVRWLIYIGVISLLPGVDLLAHLGGFVSGFLLGKIMKDRQPVTPNERKLANVLGWGAVVVVVASMAMIARDLLQGGS